MSDNKKYYYLKLKDNFFDSDEMIVLESMDDGYVYSNILLKLYLRSLKYEGRLMFNDRISFNSSMLAKVTRHSVGNVEKAIQIFVDLNLLEVLDNGAIYVSDIQNFIGTSSTEADRQREYRLRIKSEKDNIFLENKSNDVTNVTEESDKCHIKSTPEIENKSNDVTNVTEKSDKCHIKSTPEIRDRVRDRVRDRDRDRDRDMTSNKSKPKPIRHKYGDYENVLLSDSDKEKLMSEFPNDWGNRIERLSEYMASTGKSYKNHLATIRNWAKRDGQQGEQGFNAKVKPSERLRDWDQYQPPVDQGRQAELERKMAQFLEEDF